MIPLIEQRSAELVTLCRRYRVRRLELFGSAAKGTFRQRASDLDFIVVFDDAGERGYATRYYDFAVALENLFQRPVDLLTERMIGNPIFREEVDRTREMVYEQDRLGSLARCACRRSRYPGVCHRAHPR